MLAVFYKKTVFDTHACTILTCVYLDTPSNDSMSKFKTFSQSKHLQFKTLYTLILYDICFNVAYVQMHTHTHSHWHTDTNTRLSI